VDGKVSTHHGENAANVVRFEGIRISGAMQVTNPEAWQDLIHVMMFIAHGTGACGKSSSSWSVISLLIRDIDHVCIEQTLLCVFFLIRWAHFTSHIH
jgi:hypothetical protein